MASPDALGATIRNIQAANEELPYPTVVDAIEALNFSGAREKLQEALGALSLHKGETDTAKGVVRALKDQLQQTVLDPLDELFSESTTGEGRSALTLEEDARDDLQEAGNTLGKRNAKAEEAATVIRWLMDFLSPENEIDKKQALNEISDSKEYSTLSNRMLDTYLRKL